VLSSFRSGAIGLVQNKKPRDPVRMRGRRSFLLARATRTLSREEGDRARTAAGHWHLQTMILACVPDSCGASCWMVTSLSTRYISVTCVTKPAAGTKSGALFDVDAKSLKLMSFAGWRWKLTMLFLPRKSGPSEFHDKRRETRSAEFPVANNSEQIRSRKKIIAAAIVERVACAIRSKPVATCFHVCMCRAAGHGEIHAALSETLITI
jgi:hypothetical protein